MLFELVGLDASASTGSGARMRRHFRRCGKQQREMGGQSGGGAAIGSKVKLLATRALRGERSPV